MFKYALLVNGIGTGVVRTRNASRSPLPDGVRLDHVIRPNIYQVCGTVLALQYSYNTRDKRRQQYLRPFYRPIYYYHSSSKNQNTIAEHPLTASQLRPTKRSGNISIFYIFNSEHSCPDTFTVFRKLEFLHPRLSTRLFFIYTRLLYWSALIRRTRE